MSVNARILNTGLNVQQPPSNNDDNQIVNTPNPSSPSKNRRRRRRNRNQNNHKQSNKTKTKPIKHQQTRLHQSVKKQTPWNTVNNSSKFENIMNEQQTTNNPSSIYDDIADQDLLEQQMILQSIIESNQIKPKEPPSNIENDDAKQVTIHNNDQKQTEFEDELNTTDTVIADEMLAIYFQQQEQQKLLRNQQLSKIHDGKYGKVTSSSAHNTAIPKSALNFYYDDASMMNGNGMNKQQYKEHQECKAQIHGIAGNKTESKISKTVLLEESVAISKHDAKIWSETHIQRLNEYEAGGNLDTEITDMTISNQAYNSFRNQLDKKGFINYHNYHFEPNNKKR